MGVGQIPLYVRICIFKKLTEQELALSIFKKKYEEWSTFGAYSFNGNKIITTSGGGALISEDKAMIDQSRFLATQARDDAPHYEHSHIGYNYRMSNITAGIGRGQLQVLDKHIALRRANNLWYQSIFKAYDFITVFKEPTAESLRLAMTEENIECRPLWKPMHQQPIFKHHPAYMNGTSDLLFEKGLCLPSGSNLTDEEYKRIEEALHNALS
jgi:dTDP-4-amino-4,6-dideoxygalactose transaminase